LRVSARGGPDLRNVVTPVHLMADTSSGLMGQIVDWSDLALLHS
jgi:hypothetical protein